MFLVSHPTGNTNLRQVIDALHRNNLLHSFHTTISIRPEHLRLLPHGMGSELARRSFDLPTERIVTHMMPGLKEAARLAMARCGPLGRAIASANQWPVDVVYQDHDNCVAEYLKKYRQKRDLPTGVYCYEDGAERTFQTAKELGLFCVYDQPIPYWKFTQTLLKEEAERLPQWACTIHGLLDPPEKLERKTRELELADLVFCNSDFTLDSLPDHIRKKKKCLTALYGADPIQARLRPAGAGNQPLKLLFAGLLSQRKGLADLFAAMKLVNRSDVVLVLMGNLLADMQFYRSQYSDFVFEPPRPRWQVLELMKQCDVFVFPSLVEGRGLVQAEAMSCGLPVIATKNAASSDLIVDGQTGFLVPIRSPEALAEKINWLADNRAVLAKMSTNAQEKVSSLLWSSYHQTIVDALKDLTGQS